ARAYIGAAALGIGAAFFIAYLLVYFKPQTGIAGLLGPAWLKRLQDSGLFRGYLGRDGQDLTPDHLRAFVAFGCSLLLYIGIGLYGYWQIGRKHTFPSLCSALMLMMLFTWMLAGVAFFFDAWRVPILAIIGVAGTLTAQSSWSDHRYHLRPRLSK